MRFPGIMVSSVAMLPSAGVVMELTACQASLPVVAMVTSPPRASSSRVGPVVPEVCLAMPKSKRRKMRGGGGNGDDDGTGDGGNFYGNWRWEGDGEGDGEDDARKWGIMWNMLGVYSALQTLYFILFGKEEKVGSPILATITYSLYARWETSQMKCVMDYAFGGQYLVLQCPCVSLIVASCYITLLAGIKTCPK